MIVQFLGNLRYAKERLYGQQCNSARIVRVRVVLKGIHGHSWERGYSRVSCGPPPCKHNMAWRLTWKSGVYPLLVTV